MVFVVRFDAVVVFLYVGWLAQHYTDVNDGVCQFVTVPVVFVVRFESVVMFLYVGWLAQHYTGYHQRTKPCNYPKSHTSQLLTMVLPLPSNVESSELEAI